MPTPQDDVECIREAARTLLAAASDPVTYGLPEPVPHSLLVNLILRDISMDRPETAAAATTQVATPAQLAMMDHLHDAPVGCHPSKHGPQFADQSKGCRVSYRQCTSC